jgi:hypothetical protein
VAEGRGPAGEAGLQRRQQELKDSWLDRGSVAAKVVSCAQRQAALKDAWLARRN